MREYLNGLTESFWLIVKNWGRGAIQNCYGRRNLFPQIRSTLSYSRKISDWLYWTSTGILPVGNFHGSGIMYVLALGPENGFWISGRGLDGASIFEGLFGLSIRFLLLLINTLQFHLATVANILHFDGYIWIRANGSGHQYSSHRWTHAVNMITIPLSSAGMVWFMVRGVVLARFWLG